MLEKSYILAMQMIPDIGGITIRALESRFGSAEAVWKAKRETLEAAGIIKGKKLEQFCHFRKTIEPLKEAEALAKKGISYICWKEGAFPVQLLEIYNPPAGLFYTGTLPVWDRGIAVVGARKASVYGKNACRYIVQELTKSNAVIISGGALGIDAAAHQAAVEAGGISAAVMGCGLDITYPRGHASLFAKIRENGALISEYPLGMPPKAGNFPARNRIISGLARGVLVVEAAMKSGSLITAELALEEGRDVFAVPGGIFSEQSQGTNHLIQQGACLVTSANDIVKEYGWNMENKKKQVQSAYTLEEYAVLECLAPDQAVAAEKIVDATKLPLDRVSMILLKLELEKQIERIGAQQYVRSMRSV